MDYNNVDLLNSSSYLEQKINLRGTTNWDGSKINNQIFLIPTFKVVGFPIANAEKTAYYYIELSVQKGYGDLNEYHNPKTNILKNVIFQYDVNYSDGEQARGSVSISTSVTYQKDNGTNNKNATLFDNNLTPIVGHKMNADNLLWNTYKIMVPIVAIKKNDVNVLNYSFTSDKPTNINDAFYVSDNNYGSLTFYFNQKPLYQLTITPSIFSSNIFNLEINNPIALTTDIKDFDNPLFICTLRGKSLVNEKFVVKGNNLNNSNVVPIKIRHVIEYPSYFDKSDIDKIMFFHNNFNLAQNTTLNISEENSKFYQNKKVDASLVKDFNEKTDYNFFQETYQLQYTSNVFDGFTNTIFANDEISKNQFDLPLFDKFHFEVNVPLTFQTFFKYDVNIKFVENSTQPIIGDDYSKVTIQKLTKDNDEQWTQSQTIILKYEEILRFYSSDSFTYTDYEHLNKGSDSYV